MSAPAIDLAALFGDPSMLTSLRNWQQAGFQVAGEGTKSDIMVASHPSAPGYLFKCYSDKLSFKEQRQNYKLRVEGSEHLRSFITMRRLSQIVVPQKYLHTFTRDDRAACVLVVERLSLLTNTEARRRYCTLDDETLRQLCVMLKAYRGLDSGVRNVSITTEVKIAFVDTERWNQNRERTPFKYLRKYLMKKQKAFVDAFFA